MEAAFCCLALREKFVPVSINITEPDLEAEGLRIVTSPIKAAPKTAISNSSAFAGSNVSLVLNAFV
jgi:3-oxoacyl-(acyl-carrier-protein) synthase